MWANQMDLLPDRMIAPTLYTFGDSIEKWAAEALQLTTSDRLIIVGCSDGMKIAAMLGAQNGHGLAHAVRLSANAANLVAKISPGSSQIRRKAFKRARKHTEVLDLTFFDRLDISTLHTQISALSLKHDGYFIKLVVGHLGPI